MDWKKGLYKKSSHKHADRSEKLKKNNVVKLIVNCLDMSQETLIGFI